MGRSSGVYVGERSLSVLWLRHNPPLPQAGEEGRLLSSPACGRGGASEASDGEGPCRSAQLGGKGSRQLTESLSFPTRLAAHVTHIPRISGF